MRRIAAAPLLHFFRGGKSGEKNAFYHSDAVRLSADIVEASSNLYAAVKTTALTIFAASPPRKKSCDFFRGLRIFLCKSLKEIGV